jgi:tetratricopeptide (TPR) repeat protein
MIRVIILSLGLLSGLAAIAQKADSLHRAAKEFMRKGDYPNAIVVLGNALKMQPGDLEMSKDLAFAYYLQKNYSSSVETGKMLVERKDADEQCYQLLGMAYKAIDEKKECDKLYKQGIKRFPNSGVLYNEYGEMLWVAQNPDAIRLWEKGIEVEPGYSGNYYNACKYYYLTYDKVWSLIYGEIFVNLESYSRRTPEIKSLLVDAYKKLFMDLKSPKSLNTKNAFAAAYMNIMNDQTSVISLGITPESLTILRSKFVLEWFDKYAARYPFRLFEYHRQLMKEGLFDAYNQWIFGASQNLSAFQTWTTAHSDEYNRFIGFQKGRVFKLPPGQYYHTALK